MLAGKARKAQMARVCQISDKMTRCFSVWYRGVWSLGCVRKANRDRENSGACVETARLLKQWMVSAEAYAGTLNLLAKWADRVFIGD